MLSLRVPIDAVITMGAKTLVEVYSQLMSTEQSNLIDVLTFCYVNTPIIENATGKLVAYVTYWITGVVTVCRVNGEQVALLGSRPWDHWPSKIECEELCCQYWKE